MRRDRLLYFCGLLLGVALWACRAKAPTPVPKAPTPSVLFGRNTFQTGGVSSRLAISPTGSKLAILNKKEAKIIDLASRSVLLHIEMKMDSPQSAVFVKHERALLVVSSGFTGHLYSFDGGDPLVFEDLSGAEADATGDRILLSFFDGTYLAAAKDLHPRKKRRWEKKGTEATFLPSGEIAELFGNQVKVGERSFLLPERPTNSVLWADPSGDRLIVAEFGAYYEERPRGALPKTYRLQEVSLSTGRVQKLSLPPLIEHQYLRMLKGSISFWVTSDMAWYGGDVSSPESPWFYDLSLNRMRYFPKGAELLKIVDDAVLSPNGEVLYLSSPRGVFGFSVSTGELIDKEAPTHEGKIQEMLFSEDDTLLISRDPKSILVWDLATYEVRYKLPLSSTALCVVGDVLLISTEVDFRAFQLSDGQELWRQPTTKFAWTLLPREDGDVTAWLGDWGANDPVLREAIVISPKSGVQRPLTLSESLIIASKGYQSDLFTATGDRVLFLSAQGEPSILYQGKVNSAGVPVSPRSISWLLGGKLAAVTSEARSVVLLDGKTAEQIGVTDRNICDSLCKLVASPVARLLAVESLSGVHLWDFTSQRLRWGLIGASAHAPAFSHNGRWLALALADEEISLYPIDP